MNKENNNLKVVLNTLNIYNEEDIKRVYRYLAKSFHPDSENGSKESFEVLNNLYNKYKNAIKNLNNIHQGQGNFSVCLNTILKENNVDIRDFKMQERIYETLINYAKDSNQPYLVTQLNAILNNIKEFENNINKLNNYFPKIEELNFMDEHNPSLIDLTDKYAVIISKMVTEAQEEVKHFNNKDQVANYLNTSFKMKYNTYLTAYAQDYINYNNRNTITTLNNFEKELHKDGTVMTFNEAFELLKHLEKLNKVEQKGTKQSLDLSGVVESKPVSNVKQMENKTKGILNHLYKNSYFNINVYNNYNEMINEATTYDSLKNIYMDIYETYYYEPAVLRIKQHIIDHSNELNNPELAVELNDAINNYNDVIPPKVLRDLSLLKFDNESRITKVISSLSESESHSKGR